MSIEEVKQTHRGFNCKYNFKYTQDWFTHASRYIEPILNTHLTPPKVKFLEIGTFEGRSTMWFLEKYCHHPYSSITSIDLIPSDLLYYNLSLLDANDKKKITHIRDKSVNVLPTLSDKYDFIYIDGSHFPDDIMTDAVLSLRLLKVGGVLIFDDFNMRTVDSYDYMNEIGLNMYSNAYDKDTLSEKWDVLNESPLLNGYNAVNPYEVIQYFYMTYASILEPISINTAQLAVFVKKAESFFDTLPPNVWK